jgi:hypothetical protein
MSRVNRFWELNHGVVSALCSCRESVHSAASELALESSQFVFIACRGKAADSEEDNSPVLRAVIMNIELLFETFYESLIIKDFIL